MDALAEVSGRYQAEDFDTDLLRACIDHDIRVFEEMLALVKPITPDEDDKLQTLEHRVCGRRRSGDIPGAEIPAAYHAFVRTGNAAEMSLIIKHNRLDLLTLAELLTKLPD